MALAYEGFDAYAVRLEGLPSEVEDLVMHFILMCDNKASVTAARSVMYGEGPRAAVTFLWLGGVTS